VASPRHTIASIQDTSAAVTVATAAPSYGVATTAKFTPISRLEEKTESGPPLPVAKSGKTTMADRHLPPFRSLPYIIVNTA
jgi:hypothetical protein